MAGGVLSDRVEAIERRPALDIESPPREPSCWRRIQMNFGSHPATIALPGDDGGCNDSEHYSTIIVPRANPHPMEQIEAGLERMSSDVAADLLQRLQNKPPVFFESAVVKLLVAMGYGGADGKATVTQQSNDGGIDGIIDRDALGLDRIYIQAKRYASDSAVLRPEVQAFVGALSGKASSGVFLTTGRFSSGAVEYAANAHTPVILVDGSR